MTSRRALLRTAAWAAPTAIVAVAAPAVAASVLEDVLVFTNLTATVGKDKRVIYTNTKVMTTQGREVSGLVVTVTSGTDARTTEHVLAPWGATEIIKHEFREQSTTEPTVIRFHAEAPGVKSISGTVKVDPPNWWK